MIRRLGVAIALAGLLAGCGSRTAAHAPAHRDPAGPRAGAAARPHVAVRLWHVVVTVVDGDTGARVRGALVEAAGQSDRANRIGNAEFRLRRRAPLLVSVGAHGYAPRLLRMPFQRQRRVVVRVYQEGLQWPMYGATLARTQAHLAIRLRPPFRVVWSRGLGG